MKDSLESQPCIRSGRHLQPAPESRAHSVPIPNVVALVTDAIYPYHMGGKEVRYHHVAKGLVEAGVEVHVFTMNWWDGPRHRVIDGAHYHALCRRYPLYKNGRRSILEAVMFALACLRLLAYRFDLIEADHMPHLPLFTVRAVASLRRVPLVVTWHEFWGREYWKSYLGWPGVLAAVIERCTMRLGDAIVAPSPGTAARLVAHGLPPERVTVAPNGLDLDVIAAAEPAPIELDLLYVGRLVSHKNVDLLLASIRALEQEGLHLTCGIVGEGPERSALEAEAARLDIADRIRFLGNVESQADVYGLMKSSRLFVLPSTREGFGIVVAEAIACGLPVVTTSHEDNHARVFVDDGQTGWLAPATVPSLTRAIRTALEARSETPIDRSRVLDEFAWHATIRSILEVFARTRGVLTPT